ncbi:sigma-54-dependent Fis family transcriptional regulator [Rhodovulum sp. BSW8]|uniref:sigma-54-dependent Fis family transcriptional regulator n=1 Tax=Rhodovulum sp. BSW8 TaxID=2259645 RepID=UPI000DE20DED|nr:sigma 54-interacting transcriptional regulator [Rhodovulum sp. BSW8]RBO54438.1 sigma-54-dependent Fis family transcriptional regulator [Rhodovulum sp. BSW8]
MVARERFVRKADWVRFLETGLLPDDLDPDLAASWLRSRDSGVLPDRMTAPQVTDEVLLRKRTETAELRRLARAALLRARAMLKDTGSMMILASPDCIITETEGDPGVIDTGRENRLQIGGNWQETSIGTNGIGTAAASGRPALVHGIQHFCEEIQRWSCAAVPVLDPVDRSLRGIVDISGPTDVFLPQSMALAMAVGDEITQALARMIGEEREVLYQQFMGRRARWQNTHMILIDRRGAVLHDTRAVWSNQAIQGGAIGDRREDEWAGEMSDRFSGMDGEILRRDGLPIGLVLTAYRGRRTPVETPSGDPFDAFLGTAPAIVRLLEHARCVAGSAVPVLISGETGTGKELLARAIHDASAQRHGRYVPVNCGALRADSAAGVLFETDGPGSGAVAAAHGGTLCLDEIGEMPADVQPFLLRVLEDGLTRARSPDAPERSDFRVIALTHRDLPRDVAEDRFRRDLFHRISTIQFRLPPLRDRAEDIPLLAQHFLAQAAAEAGRQAPALTRAARETLMAYPWPGNARELRNDMQALVLFCGRGVIDAEDLPEKIRTPAAPLPRPEPDERARILKAMAASGGNMSATARRLGIARSTLYTKLAAYGLTRPDDRT